VSPSPELVLVANARLPSERAQSLQVLQAACAFARSGARTTLLHARRTHTPELPAGIDLFAHYEVPAGPRAEVVAVPCRDFIDAVPGALQYLPARLQELSFARAAARRVAAAHARAWCLSRELECARELVRRGRENVFLELHRVPGGRTRRAWLAEALEGCAGVFAISGGVAADLRPFDLDPDRIEVAHDGFEASRFADLPSRAEARGRLGLAADRRVVVYTGGLLAWKGVEVLVAAARELPDALVVIAGGMPADVERIRGAAAGLENVRVDGFQPPAAVRDYLAAADVGVVPNRSEPAISARYTSPLKVFEAMACGLPLVASDLPSLRELLTDEVDALLVAPDDPAALAAGLRRLLDDEELRAALGERLRGRAGEHTWDARAARMLRWMGRRAA